MHPNAIQKVKNLNQLDLFEEEDVEVFINNLKNFERRKIACEVVAEKFGDLDKEIFMREIWNNGIDKIKDKEYSSLRSQEIAILYTFTGLLWTIACERNDKSILGKDGDKIYDAISKHYYKGKMGTINPRPEDCQKVLKNIKNGSIKLENILTNTSNSNRQQNSNSVTNNTKNKQYDQNEKNVSEVSNNTQAILGSLTIPEYDSKTCNEITLPPTCTYQGVSYKVFYVLNPPVEGVSIVNNKIIVDRQKIGNQKKRLEIKAFLNPKWRLSAPNQYKVFYIDIDNAGTGRDNANSKEQPKKQNPNENSRNETKNENNKDIPDSYNYPKMKEYFEIDDRKKIVDRNQNENRIWSNIDATPPETDTRTGVGRLRDSQEFIRNNIQEGAIILDIGSGLGNKKPGLAGVTVFELAEDQVIKNKKVSIIATEIAEYLPTRNRHVQNFKKNNPEWEVPFYVQEVQKETDGTGWEKTDVLGIIKGCGIEVKENSQIVIRAANSIDVLMEKDELENHFIHLANHLENYEVVYLFNKHILHKQKNSKKFQVIGELNESGFDHKISDGVARTKFPRIPYTIYNEYKSGRKESGKIEKGNDFKHPFDTPGK